MNVRYAFSLLWSNMTGAFFGGYEKGLEFAKEDSPIGPLIYLGHTISLPLSVTIGAAIKTIVDLFTRTYTPQKKVDEIVSSVNAMTEKDMGDLIESLNNSVEDAEGIEDNTKLMSKKEPYSPQSKSSYALFHQLSTDAQHNTNLVNYNKNFQKKHLEYTKIELDFSGCTEAQIMELTNDVNYLQEHKHGYYYQFKLDALKPKSVGFLSSKNKLSEFMMDEDNNGKELFQRVVRFFEKKSNNNKNETITAIDSNCIM